jgi:hypothetical protein
LQLARLIRLIHPYPKGRAVKRRHRMADEEQRLQALEQHVAQINITLTGGEDDLRRRKDLRRQMRHMRQYIGILVSVFVGLFAVLGIVAALVHNSDTSERAQFEARLRSEFNEGLDRERVDRQKFETTLRDQIIAKTAMPKLSLYNIDGAPLAGQEIKLDTTYDNATTPRINFIFIVRNESDTLAGPLYFKFYFSEPLITVFASVNDEKLSYEFTFHTEDLATKSIPGNFQETVGFGVPLTDQAVIKKGRYRGMIEIYSDRGKLIGTPMYFVSDVTPAPPAPPPPPPPAPKRQ